MADGLDILVPRYGERDAKIKALTKENNRDKEQIKDLMSNLEEDNWVAGGYKVTRVISNSTTMDEDKVLQLMQKNRKAIEHTNILKTKEYVDMSALEAAIYTGTLPADILKDLDDCCEKKTTVALRCSKAKEPELEPILVKEA